MAMAIGNIDCTSGASKIVWDALSASGMPGEQMASEDDAAYLERVTALKKTCYAIAHLINEVKNADVATVLTANGAGMDSLGGIHAPGPTNLVVTGSGAGGPTSGSGGLT